MEVDEGVTVTGQRVRLNGVRSHAPKRNHVRRVLKILGVFVAGYPFFVVLAGN